MRREVAKLHGARFKRNKYLNEQRIQRIRKGQYEGPEVAAARRQITQQDRVLELGAGIGVVTTVVAVACKPERLISFDANPNLIPIVNANLEFNGVTNAECRHGIVVANHAAPESMSFNIAGNYLGSSLTDRGKTKEVVGVATVPFASLKEEFDPTALILDIEGGELDFFEGADLNSIRIIICELHPNVYGHDGVSRIFKRLGEFGFVYSTESSKGAVVTFYRP